MQLSILENGRWFELSFYDQVGNIGTEVGGMIRAKKRNDHVAMINALNGVWRN